MRQLFLDVFLDDFAQNGHALLDLLFGHAGVVQADAVVVASVREEAVARDVGNIARQALLCHLIGVDIIRQLDPSEQITEEIDETAKKIAELEEELNSQKDKYLRVCPRLSVTCCVCEA